MKNLFITVFSFLILAIAPPAKANPEALRELVAKSEEIAASDLSDDEKIAELERVRARISDIRKNDVRKTAPLPVRTTEPSGGTEKESSEKKPENGLFALLRWLLWRIFGFACVLGVIAAAVLMLSGWYVQRTRILERNRNSRSTNAPDLGKAFTSGPTVRPSQNARPEPVPQYSAPTIPRDGTVPISLR